jgi:hypothetical protein
MNIALRIFSFTLVIVTLVSCSKTTPPSPPYKHVIDMKQFMAWVMDPAADALWASVGTIISEEGEQHIAPKTDEEWAAARNNAAILAETANLLMLDTRAVDRDAWMIAARGLIDQAERAMKAAEAKDSEALFTANSDVFLACTECHQTYAFATQDARTAP